MKKIFFAEGVIFNKHEWDIIKIIKDNFQNFSLDKYRILDSKKIQSKYLSKYFLSKEIAFAETIKKILNNNSSHELSSVMILEYLLSEDDMYECLLTGEINISPSNSWYYISNDKKSKYKEFKNLALFV